MAKKSKDTIEDVSKVVEVTEDDQNVLETEFNKPSNDDISLKVEGKGETTYFVKENDSANIVNENDLLFKSVQSLLNSTKEKLSPDCLKQNPSFIVNSGYNFYFSILKTLETNLKNTTKLKMILDLVKEYFKKYNKQGLAYKFFVRYEDEWSRLGYKEHSENFKALIEVFDKVSNGKSNELKLAVFNVATINPDVKQAIKDYFIK